MNLSEIADQARPFITRAERVDYEVMQGNGFEIAPGLFNLYNELTGQSRVALLHLDSSYVFKRFYGSDKFTQSGQVLGTVNIYGKDYTVRLPYFEVFGDVSASEYVVGATHGVDDDCDSMPERGWGCDHTRAMSKVTGYMDCHVGNWKVQGDEVVLFDFE